MKKQRILSALLALSLVISSLPMIATSVAAEESTDLLAGGYEIVAAEGTTVVPYKSNPHSSTSSNQLDALGLGEGNVFLTSAGRNYSDNADYMNVSYTLTEAAVTALEGKTLYFGLYARASQPSADTSGPVSRTNGSTVGKIVFDPGRFGTWADMKITLPAAAVTAATHSFALIKGSGGAQSHDIDTDRFGLYYLGEDGTTKNYILGPIDSDFFTTVSNEYGSLTISGSNASHVTVFEDVQTIYNIATSDADTNTEFTVKLAKALEPGLYKLSGDFRLGEFKCTSGQINTIDVVLKNGETELDRNTATTVWNAYDFEFGVTTPINALTFVVDGSANSFLTASQPIQFDNLSLTLVSGFNYEVEAEGEDNLLGGATAEYNVPTTAVEGTGYLSVAKRVGGVSDTDYLTFRIPASLEAKTTYYVSFDIKSATTSIVFRPYTDFTVLGKNAGTTIPGTDATGGMKNSNWIVPASGDVTFGDWEAVSPHMPRYWAKINSQKFVGQFVPVDAVENGFSITFQRGSNANSHNDALTIDNLKIWSRDGVVYENDFSSTPDEIGENTVRYGDMSVSSKVALEIVDAQVAHTLVTPDEGDAASVTYVLTDLDTKAGTYNFKTTVAAATTAGTAKVVFTLSDDSTVECDEVDVTVTNTDYADLKASVTVPEGLTVKSVSVVTTVTSGGIKLTSPMLTFKEAKTADDKDMPNVGIVMMMLLKKRGDSAPRTKTVKTEFIENGDLSTAPTIYNAAVPKVSTAAGAGWYAKGNESDKTVITYVTEGNNSFVRISDLEANQRGVYWNTGVMLEPGTYTFSMDIRVSETAADANYTKYPWRDADKSQMQIRANLGDPNNAMNPQFSAFKPVDLDTNLNDSGTAYGNLQIASRNWTKYTDTITIDQPILAVFKIGGGTGGDKDSHGYDIDNLSIIGYKTVVVGGSEADVEETKPVVAFTNGDFSQNIEVVKEGFDSTKPAWYANAKEDYRYDDSGKPVKTEAKVYHDHTITWNEAGYITLTGRQFNLAMMYWNTGLTLEPGNYLISYDAKCANAGESTVIRMYATDLALKPFQSATPAALNDTWKTFTYEFTVGTEGGIAIAIFGGTGAKHFHDICLDNFVIVKK